MEMKIIDEQLEDKQQIVTYKYLIEKLNIHPNKAKELLRDYVAQISDDKKYSITVIIGGTLHENDEFCVVLAYDDHVKTVCRRFKHISFKHLYSIQPISRFNDINSALYLADNSLNININLHSSIKKKVKETAALSDQSNVMAMEIDDVPSIKETKSMFNEVSNHKNVTTKLDETLLTQEKKISLNGSLNSKKNKNIKPEVTETKVSPKKNNSDFFTKFKKSNISPKNSDTVKEDSLNECSLNKTTKKDEKVMDVESPKKNIQDLPVKKPSIYKKKSKNKKENGNKSNQKVKRKRIQTFNSSDEEIDSEEEDKKRSELVMDVEDEVDLVLPTPPRPTPRENRKKEKKTTTSTFIDDDGFVCTTKEVQFVETECEPSESVGNTENSVSSESNNEQVSKHIKTKEPVPVSNESNIEEVSKKVKPNELVPVEKKKSKNKQSKNNSGHGMKQSSLTSFFKTK